MNKKALILIFMSISWLLFSDIYSPKLSLSLDECLALAEKESLNMLRAELVQNEYDLDVISDRLNFLPDIEYQLRSRYSDESLIEAETEIDRKKEFFIEHSISYHQKIFSREMVDLIKNEKNENIIKEIINLSYKSSVRFIVREAYENALIFTDKIHSLEELKTKLNSLFEDNPEFYNKLLFYRTQEFITKVEAVILDTHQYIKFQKKILLKIINKPAILNLELTTPLSELKIDTDKQKTIAIQNNLFLKKYMAMKIQINNAMSWMNFSYLPEIGVELSHDINEDINLTLLASLSGSSDGFDIDFDSDIILKEKSYYYDFATETWDEEERPNNYFQKDNLVAGLFIRFPIDGIYRTNLRKKEMQNDLQELELDIKETILDILQKMDSLIDNINYYNEVLEKLDTKILIKQNIRELYDTEIKITELAEVAYYSDNLDHILALYELKYDMIREKHNNQNLYMIEMESGTRFEYIPNELF